MRFSSILFGAVITNLSAAQVCESGVYGDTLLPLYAYGPAKAFCSSRYPASTVTANKARSLEHVRRVERPWAAEKVAGSADLKAVAVASSNGPVSSAASTRTTAVSPATSQSSLSTVIPSTTRTGGQSPSITTPLTSTPSGSAGRSTSIGSPLTSTSTSTAIIDPRAAQWSSLSAGNAATLSTFCSCMGPPITVPRIRTSTSTTSNPSTANPNTPTTAPPLTRSTSSSTVSTPALGPPLTISTSTSTSTSRSSSSSTTSTRSSGSPLATCGAICKAPSSKDPRNTGECTNPSCRLCEERYMQPTSEDSTCVSCVKEGSHCRRDADCCSAGSPAYCEQYSAEIRLCKRGINPTCGTTCAAAGTATGRAVLLMWAA